MPRYKRLFLKNVPLHVVQRGHDKNAVFIEPSDYQYYLENILEAKNKYSIDVYAYCLMTNHVHLVVQPTAEPENVSRFMRLLSARQTRRVNKLEKRTGTLWEGRFKASLIDSEAYLLSCCRYVDLNPVRAMITSVPEDYRWSSYRGLAQFEVNERLDWSLPYQGLGRDQYDRACAYRKLVATGLSSEEIQFIRKALSRNQLTGAAQFLDQIAVRTGRRISAVGPGRPSRGK